MPTKHMLSHDMGAPEVLGGVSVRAASASTGWVSMVGFKKVLAFVQLGTWSGASDVLDTCKLEQATSGAGAGAKDLTTSAAGGNYDSASGINATGEFAVIEALAEDFDTENNYTYVRLTIGSTGNTGADVATAFLLRYDAEQKYEARPGAAAAGAKVYVRPT